MHLNRTHTTRFHTNNIIITLTLIQSKTAIITTVYSTLSNTFNHYLIYSSLPNLVTIALITEDSFTTLSCVYDHTGSLQPPHQEQRQAASSVSFSSLLSVTLLFANVYLKFPFCWNNKGYFLFLILLNFLAHYFMVEMKK